MPLFQVIVALVTCRVPGHVSSGLVARQAPDSEQTLPIVCLHPPRVGVGGFFGQAPCQAHCFVTLDHKGVPDLHNVSSKITEAQVMHDMLDWWIR